MTNAPIIRTAIPLQRHQLGNYQVTLLGDIESGDGLQYRYILAFVEAGMNRPTLYLCCERHRPGSSDEGAYRMRLVNAAMSEIMGTSDDWKEAEAFLAEAINIGRQVLGLTAEPLSPLR